MTRPAKEYPNYRKWEDKVGMLAEFDWYEGMLTDRVCPECGERLRVRTYTRVDDETRCRLFEFCRRCSYFKELETDYTRELASKMLAMFEPLHKSLGEAIAKLKRA